MPRMPKRIKFRKQMRGKLKGNATRGNFVAFGDYGLQALEPHWVSARQIDSHAVASVSDAASVAASCGCNPSSFRSAKLATWSCWRRGHSRRSIVS